MNHSTATYYEDHRRQQLEELPIDDEEEYSEDQFLRQHYGRPRVGGLNLVQDDSDADDDDEYTTNHHLGRNRFDDDDDDDDDEGDEDEDDDYDEVDMDPHSIQLLSGSLSVRKYLHRLSGDSNGWGGRSSLSMIAEKQRPTQEQPPTLQQQSAPDHPHNTNQSDNSKPRGPRPPVLLGRPRSNSSLTRVTTGFDIPPSTNAHAQDSNELSTSKGDEASVLRQSQVSPESTMQDLEVKRVLEVDADPAVSFGQDTQKSIDDFFGMVKSDLDKRIQEAIQEVEQKFLDRVKRLEEQTATLSGAPPGMSLSLEDGEGGPKAGSLMESLTRPLPAHQNPGGSMALRKEILSHVTEKVGDLDLRVNQMEVLVSYKLVDIESKVQDLHGAHNTIAQKVHQVAKSHKSNMQGMRAGDGVGQDTINAEEIRIDEAMKPYRDMDAQGQGAGAFLEPLSPDTDEDKEGIVSLRGTVRSNADAPSTDLVDASSSVVELRHELHDLGMRYQELNDGLLTDLMGQMRDAKLILFQTVDEVDGRISKRVDRIEAEMHSKLLSEIEGRVQERVRAMEQTSSRLEKCFDKMEGRLGALETVLASKRPRPESMYQLLQQQLQQQQQQQQEEAHGVLPYHAETFAGFSSSPSSGHRSVTSMVFAEGEARPVESGTQHSRPRRRTLAENGIYPDRTQSGRHDSITSEEPLMMLETASMHSTVKNNSSDNHYSTSHAALTASPLEGFVSQAHGKPVWSPVRGVSSSQPSSFSSGATSLVSSPLERGTVIGGRMGTIHPEYTPRTSYVPATPSKDKFQGALSLSDKASDGTHGSRNRRVSLSSFDASSLSALKPVSRPPTTASSSDRSASTSFVTTTTTTTTTTMAAQHSNDSSHDKGSRRSSHGNLSVKTSSSSLLTAKLNEASSHSAGGSQSSSNGNGNSHSHSQTGSSSSSTPTRTMQRAMTFDTLHSQASSSSSIVRTVKTPVQGPSSYRDLLHFWKAGGSTSTPAQGTAV
ncbi:hypothetical protein BGZ70_009019 [Mortierella alpina]|uniref:Uncharacterized protein n=1 Tax=Mortierella alpina TaxID=64518 RepID=A0A9P6JF57_MORAP|nr:hypothetical protein BGZ70_009019 [Mortierella alpina]